MFERKKLLLVSDKCKTLDVIIYFFPHVFCKYPEFEDPSVFEADQ